MKIEIHQDNSDPLWKECVRRFNEEVKNMAPDSPTGFVREEKRRLSMDDFTWFLLTDDSGYEMIIREKKNEVS